MEALSLSPVCKRQLVAGGLAIRAHQQIGRRKGRRIPGFSREGRHARQFDVAVGAGLDQYHVAPIRP